MHAELGVDVGQVVFDRLGADDQLVGDLAVGEAFSGEAGDGALCRRENPHRCRLAVRPEACQGGVYLLQVGERAGAGEDDPGGPEMLGRAAPVPLRCERVGIGEL